VANKVKCPGGVTRCLQQGHGLPLTTLGLVMCLLVVSRMSSASSTPWARQVLDSSCCLHTTVWPRFQACMLRHSGWPPKLSPPLPECTSLKRHLSGMNFQSHGGDERMTAAGGCSRTITTQRPANSIHTPRPDLAQQLWGYTRSGLKLVALSPPGTIVLFCSTS